MKNGQSKEYREVCKKDITKISVNDIGHKLIIEAEIGTISQIHIIVEIAHFECPSCGNIIMVYQNEFKFKKLKGPCSCGRKSKFINFKNDMIEFRMLQLIRDKNSLIHAAIKGPMALREFNQGDYIELLVNVDYKLHRYGKGFASMANFYLEVERILNYKIVEKKVE